MARIRIGQNSLPLPKSRIARTAIGGLLVTGGFLGFLPILGFWMIPLGFLVLSFDLSSVRRLRRQFVVKHAPRLRQHYPRLAGWLGFGNQD
jgi:hypothetical protein